MKCILITRQLCNTLKKQSVIFNISKFISSFLLILHFFLAQVQCEICRKSVLADRLKFHLMLHSGVKSHLCERCGRSFTLKCYLAQHIRINHSQIERAKRFICAYCGYAAVSKDKLEIHERTHTGERVINTKILYIDTSLIKSSCCIFLAIRMQVL